MSNEQPLVQVEDLVVRFPVKNGSKRAWITPVDHVSFSIRQGEVLSLVGESGSGKTTIGRALLRIYNAASGKMTVAGQDATKLRGKELRKYRGSVQMVFQDPFGSLNPANTIESHITFPVKYHRGLRGGALYDNVGELLETVGLAPADEYRNKYPHEISGGQRQRVAIARALAANPRFLVADEPISMLDVSIRAGILKLLNQLKDEFNLAYLYITHDLASARYFGDRIMVLYGGRVMETGTADELVANPLHPYTQLLLASSPGGATGRNVAAETSLGAPNLFEGRQGCPFAHRCPHVKPECKTVVPELKSPSADHQVACHLV